jgi:hypothetical protein
MRRIFRTGRYANVTATLALIVALGGTSYAAIKLPANSVTSKTVKDRSLLSKDFKRGQIPAGKTGPAGAAGPAGAQGAQGFPGPAGVTASAYKATETGPAVQTGASQTVDSITLPGGGNWVVTAKLIANNTGLPDPANLSCSLTIDGVAKDSLGASGTDFGVGGSAITLTGAGVGSTAAVVCTTNTSAGNYEAISLTALRVSSIS